ncbi:MAG: alpha/beta fold hydrolase [Candidatus Obscuribacterales bacterium]|nr:alpha/beta fold hydrolase [Steroidobacteraceae bacterium]
MPADHIIIVHGLWMTGLELGVLQHRLRTDHGFEASIFSYPSITGTMAEHVASLRSYAEAQKCERLHFVGHSLGGIVTLKLLVSTDNLPPGRVVCLASPMQGSCAVNGFARWPFARAALGAAICDEVLTSKPRQWDGRRDVGIIAGSLSIGLGRLFADFQEPSDGTLLVSETKLEGAKDHIIMPVSHTGIVFSAEATAQIAKFLRDGKFSKESAVG